jgi:hypothetical protein
VRRIWIPRAIAGAILLWALNPDNLYGYYVLLRWTCCAVFAYLAIKALEWKKERWVWILGITAAVHNPIISIHLTRKIWSAVNVATVVLATLSVSVLRSSPAPAQSSRKDSDSTSIDEARNGNTR